MPELPEVETVVNFLKPSLEGETITSVKANRNKLRYDIPQVLLTDQLANIKINSLSRHGKYMFWNLSNNHSLIIHLGMSGRFFSSILTDTSYFYHDKKLDAKHEHLIFHLGNHQIIRYYDPRRFGFFDYCPTQTLYHNKFIQKLGVDGLDVTTHTHILYNKLVNSKCDIKSWLMNQSFIAGIGNIYASEALFKSAIHPQTQSCLLNFEKFALLIYHIKDILIKACHFGGSTLKDYQKPSGEKGAFQNEFLVYDRENQPCLTSQCYDVIRRIVQQNRATYFCERCQKL